MAHQSSRISWNTSLKQHIRNGYYKTLPKELQNKIPRTNKHRWEGESESKYSNHGFENHINNQTNFYNNIEDSPKIKSALENYFVLLQTFHEIIAEAKGTKQLMAKHKEKLVNAIELVKDIIPVQDAIKVFNISRATYQNYKTLVLNKCDASYFKWCLKRYPHQLVYKEISKIESYFKDEKYKHWSKASLYYAGLRNNDFSFGLTTFYKYSKLLGYKLNRHLQQKKKYDPLVSTKPNEIWCADVTILKTLDGKKHYIHFLIDHYSKMVLGYQVCSSAKPKIIKSLLQKAFEKYSSKETIDFVTDGGVENVNTTVQNYVLSTGLKIVHKIAQKTIPESNSMIEAFNKIIKHQFLLPRHLENLRQLLLALEQDVYTYNNIRPQQNLLGNTPAETFAGKPISSSNYKSHFLEEKILRITQNHLNRCKKCSN
ncbi:transposase [Flavobacterium psychrophilum]